MNDVSDAASSVVTPRFVSFTGANGHRLAASVFGEGERTALLLHGGGQTRFAWEDTAAALARAGWRAITVDQRGHGESDWCNAGAYAFADYGDDAALIGAEIEERFGAPPVAIGASLGGIASLLALGQSARPCFAGLILVDVTPRLAPAGVDRIQGFMRAHAAEGFGSVDEAAEAVAAYLPHRPRPKSLEGLRKNLRLDADGRWRWHWDPRFLEGPRNINTDWDEVENRLLAASRDLSVPTLLVRGRSSELVTEEAAKEFRALAPHADYVDIAGARHMVAGDRNDVFTRAIIAFLDRRFPR
jgi:pimeloyl-ACP methyl ester carboxylesterase